MTCSKLMRNSDTGGVGKNEEDFKIHGFSKVSPVSGSRNEKTGPATPTKPLKPNSKSMKSQQPEPEKVYGYIDLFKTLGDSLPSRMFSLTLQTVTIGRDKSCQIQIHDNPRVSRNQCAIVVVPDQGNDNVKIVLRNLTPRPTTVHRNKVLGTGEDVVLSHGDRFRVYDVELRWRTYDPVNEKGQLDWTRPIPVIRLNPPQDSSTPQEEPILEPAPLPPPSPPVKKGPVTTPIIKITRPSSPMRNNNVIIPTTTNNYSWMNKSISEQRRKSSPLPLSSSAQSKLDLLKISRWSSNNNSSNNNNKNNNNNNSNGSSKTLDKNQRNDENNLSNLNVMNSYDRRRASTGNYLNTMNMSYKRRGSGDIDMRKAVLQRSLRRAFKERSDRMMMSQTSNTENAQPEVPISRYRRALTDLIVLSSAA